MGLFAGGVLYHHVTAGRPPVAAGRVVAVAVRLVLRHVAGPEVVEVVLRAP